MKKILILFLIFSFEFISSTHAKNIIFKNCYAPYDNKFDTKKFEKYEVIVDTSLNSAKIIYIWTDMGLIAETERIKGLGMDKQLGNYRPEKINVSNFVIEYIDNNYITLLPTQLKTSTYGKLTLNLDKKNIDQTLIVNGRPVSTFLAFNCSGSSQTMTGESYKSNVKKSNESETTTKSVTTGISAKNILKKIIKE